MERGTIIWYGQIKKYGFIEQDADPEVDLFVHKANIVTKQLLKEGDRVTFDIEAGPKGLTAIHVDLE